MNLTCGPVTRSRRDFRRSLFRKLIPLLDAIDSGRCTRGTKGLAQLGCGGDILVDGADRDLRILTEDPEWVRSLGMGKGFEKVELDGDAPKKRRVSFGPSAAEVAAPRRELITGKPTVWSY